MVLILDAWTRHGITELAELRLVYPRATAAPELPRLDAARAVAYVSRGRWLADCPTDGCKNAEYVAFGLPFMCSECGNVEIDGEYRPVEFPDDVEQITRALSRRLVPDVANWSGVPRTGWAKGETLADLERENGEHDVPERRVR